MTEKCTGRWVSGSGGHRGHEPCDQPATWTHPEEPFAYCDKHIMEHDRPLYRRDVDQKNPLDLEDIRARSANATLGPWRASWRANFQTDIRTPLVYVKLARGGSLTVCEPNEEEDAEFIAHAREDIPALIAEVERLRASSLTALLSKTIRIARAALKRNPKT